MKKYVKMCLDHLKCTMSGLDLTLIKEKTSTLLSKIRAPGQQKYADTDCWFWGLARLVQS